MWPMGTGWSPAGVPDTYNLSSLLRDGTASGHLPGLFLFSPSGSPQQEHSPPAIAGLFTFLASDIMGRALRFPEGWPGRARQIRSEAP